MARLHGRRGTLYVSLDGTAAPTPVAYLNQWSVEATTDKSDVTSFGDTNKVYVAGLPDAKGSVSGFYDGGATGTGSDALYNGASDGIARNFYLYIDSSASPVNDYFYGQALWDFSIAGSSDGPVTISANWQAAASVTFKKT